jgi:hypothetical protein
MPLPDDPQLRLELEAQAFRSLLAHIQSRPDVQNIDLMNLAGFCRNCLARWYQEAAIERDITLSTEEARTEVYGMPPGEWKKQYQREASPSSLAAFAENRPKE